MSLRNRLIISSADQLYVDPINLHSKTAIRRESMFTSSNFMVIFLQFITLLVAFQVFPARLFTGWLKHRNSKLYCFKTQKVTRPRRGLVTLIF